jgi:hypothetical protein
MLYLSEFHTQLKLNRFLEHHSYALRTLLTSAWTDIRVGQKVAQISLLGASIDGAEHAPITTPNGTGTTAVEFTHHALRLCSSVTVAPPVGAPPSART